MAPEELDSYWSSSGVRTHTQNNTRAMQANNGTTALFSQQQPTHSDARPDTNTHLELLLDTVDLQLLGVG